MKYQVKDTQITRNSHREYAYAVIVKGQTTGKARAFSATMQGALNALRREEQFYPMKSFEVKEVIKL